MIRFAKGTTIKIGAEITDNAGELLDPSTSTKVTVFKGSTTKVNAVDMVRESVGKYRYYWQSATTDAVGKYEVKVTTVHGGYTSIEHGRTWLLPVLALTWYIL